MDRHAGASRRESGVKPDPPGGEDTVLRSAIANVERATYQGGRRQHGAATSTGELAELGVAPRERSANPTNSVGLGNFGHRHRDPGACPQNRRCPPAALTESADRGEEWPRHFGRSKGANSAPRRGPIVFGIWPEGSMYRVYIKYNTPETAVVFSPQIPLYLGYRVIDDRHLIDKQSSDSVHEPFRRAPAGKKHPASDPNTGSMVDNPKKMFVKFLETNNLQDYLPGA